MKRTIKAEDARQGETPHVTRYVLLGGFLLGGFALMLIWALWI